MQDNITAIIVDDEELARGILKEYLADFPETSIVAECVNGFEAVKAVNELNPQLLFLDIQMPKLNGFEVLELLQRQPAVVFITAYDEYALRAFDVHAVDYLLKPFSRERLAEALAHAKQRLKNDAASPISALIEQSRAHASPLERILIRDGAKVHIIPTAKIDYLEAQDDYVCIKSEGKDYLKQETLGSLETHLDPAKFIRIHRSYILNVERLQRLELFTKEQRIAILAGGARLPVSKAGYLRLKPLL